MLQFVAVGHARSSPHASLSQSPPIVQAQNMMSTSSFISLDVLAVRWHWHCLLLQHRSIPWQSRPCGCLRVYVSMLWQLLSSLSPVPPPQLFLGAQEDFAFQRYVACTAGLVHSQHNNQMHRLRTCFRLPVIASKQCDAAAVLGGQLVETVVEEEWWKYVQQLQDLPHVRVD